MIANGLISHIIYITELQDKPKAACTQLLQLSWVTSSWFIPNFVINWNSLIKWFTNTNGPKQDMWQPAKIKSNGINKSMKIKVTYCPKTLEIQQQVFVGVDTRNIWPQWSYRACFQGYLTLLALHNSGMFTLLDKRTRSQGKTNHGTVT